MTKRGRGWKLADVKMDFKSYAEMEDVEGYGKGKKVGCFEMSTDSSSYTISVLLESINTS